MTEIITSTKNKGVTEFLCENIFQMFLGLDYKLSYNDQVNETIIRNSYYNSKVIKIKSVRNSSSKYFDLSSYVFFDSKLNLLGNFSELCSKFSNQIKYFRPLLKGNTITFTDDAIETDVDIFGLIFFMLSRVEEIDRIKLDSHGRFVGTSSKAYQHGFLERPIVDEYVEFLWSLMKCLWPNLERKEEKPKTIVGCDVDTPYDCSSRNLLKLIRPLAGDILKRADVLGALNRIKRFISFRVKDEIDSSVDPNYTFDWYMDVVESYGLKATFFFISNNSDGKSGCYSIKENKINFLIKKILDRGHHIGLHGSYSSYNNQEKLIKEKNILQSVIDDIGYVYKITESRQHYLRWDPEITVVALDNAGILVDHSGSYADHIGFRYGTSKRFKAFSLTQEKMLNVMIQPLHIMDCSLFDREYQGLDYSDETANYINDIINKALSYGGSFSMLWHNNYFKNPSEEYFFKLLLESVNSNHNE